MDATRLRRGLEPANGKLTRSFRDARLSLITISQNTGVLNTYLPALVPPSTGPQQFVRGAKGKGKEIDKGKGKRKRVPKAALAPGVDWPNTTRRLCAEMVNIFNQPTREVPNPAAYTRSTEFIQEDLHL